MEQLWQQQILPRADNLIEESPQETWPVLAGMASFGLTLAVSTSTQLHLLGVSTGSRPPIPSVLGMATVCLASLASHQAAIRTNQQMESWKRKRGIASSKSFLRYFPPPIQHAAVESNHRHAPKLEQWNVGGGIQIPLQTVRICIVGLLAFKLLGGRFWAISPSSYTHLGSFARKSLPATEQYASTTQKHALTRIGRLFGCHTCGTRTAAQFIGDHMPPKAVAIQYNQRWYNRILHRRVQFRFYPQCSSCSNRQGGLIQKAIVQKRNLKGAGGGQLAHFHGLRPRWNHLTGAIVAGTTVVGANPHQIQKGNPGRYRDLQIRVQRMLDQLVVGVMGQR